MTRRKVDIAGFLEEVIKKTFVSIDRAELRKDREWIEKLHTPEGLNIVEAYSKLKSPVMRDFASAALADYPGFVQKEEERYKQRQKDYNASRRAFSQYMSEHRSAVEYIAVLADGREAIETPPEELVFNTLSRAQGISCMDFADPERGLEWTLSLYAIVKNAAHEHAIRTGRNPEEYFTLVTADKSLRGVVL